MAIMCVRFHNSLMVHAQLMGREVPESCFQTVDEMLHPKEDSDDEVSNRDKATTTALRGIAGMM